MGKVLAILGNAGIMLKSGEKGPRLLDGPINNQAPSDLEFLIYRWSVERHTFLSGWDERGLMLKDVVNITTMPICGETNAMGVAFEKDDKQKTTTVDFPHKLFEGVELVHVRLIVKII